jgi:predicted GNAT family N-acyltransferase
MILINMTAKCRWRKMRQPTEKFHYELIKKKLRTLVKQVPELKVDIKPDTILKNFYNNHCF